MNERGVSEVLGFVLVFALVTGTIGIVYATGISGLHNAQQAEKLENVERAFDVLADNVDDLHRTGAPSRGTEVKLAGGSVRVGDPVTVRIRAENSSNPLDNATYVQTVEPIVYEDDGGTSILYVQGAVIRSQSGGVTMLREPDWIARSNRSVLSRISTHGESGGISGSGTVLIVTQAGSRTLQTPFSVDGSSTAVVNVTVTSPRAEAWERYFVEQGFDPVDTDLSDDDVTYQFETETLYVPKTSVEVTFNR